MRLVVTAGALGTLVLVGAAGAVTLTQGASPATVPTSVNLVSASGPAATAADNAALSYVDQQYPGTGTAVVLKTESDTEHGIPVYDVKVTAPNGSTYSLSVQASNDTVLSAQRSETQTSQTGTSTPEPTQTPEATDTPEATPTAEPSQSPDSSGTSQDSQDTSQQQQTKTSKDS